MRLFLAAEIDDDTRVQLAAAQHALQSVLKHARVPPRITWVDPLVAHVTIRFIGETSEETATRVQAALAALPVHPFAVRWGAMGIFGGNRHPKSIWVGPIAGQDGLARLAQDIDARLDPVIGGGRTQPLMPHLTLGRVKDRGSGADWTRALQAVSFTPTVTRIEQVTLYQSRLSSKGPTYTAMSRHG
jgi:2'-5' RNA ligase